jgi:branched-chain amino acid transport system substrate-binding protein
MAALAAGLAVGLVAGCGSSSGGSGAGGSSPAPKLTGAPIVVGTIGSYTGAEAASEGGAKATIEAWADYVNAHGGINGHPVKLYVIDDGSSPSAALQGVQTLVQQDHVVAIVGEESNVDTTWASYAEQSGVPVVGGLALDVPFSTNPDFFASGTSSFASIWGVLMAAKAAGGKLAILYCAEAPQCAAGVPLDEAISQAAGTKVVYTTKVSATATSYAAPCLAAKQAGATSMFIADNAAVSKAVADGCLQQGVKLVQLSLDSAISNTWLGDPAFGSANVTELDEPFFATSNAAGKTYVAALKQYASSIVGTPLDDPDDTYAWAGGLLFQAAAKAANLGPKSTAADVKKGLYKLQNETLGGFTPPLSFSPGKADVVPCYFTFTISGTKYTLPHGLKTACAPTVVVNAIAAEVSKAS